MPNKNYQNGRALEYRVKRQLEDDGWFVTRSSGSHGPADLVALKRGRPPLLVQCKANGRISPEEREELVKVSKSVGAVPMLAAKGMGIRELELA
ncbi:MAG: hypothetical protein JRM72_08410 [Nitrososphaerota archaeon]|jgi:Holliday junction resolvase|nr:hypothetical protein [Nitrososphaerota archaeon]